MTTISTYLAASLVAVTFGWVPADDADPSAGYDYLVKVTPDDLASIRDGQADSLVSELPDDVGPIRRIRVYVGQGDAPRRLTPRDEQSPQRIAAADRGPVTQTSLKPVVPEWKDAARLLKQDDDAPAEEPLSDTAQQRTAYQNPDPLNLRGLAQGFEEGTRSLADGTRQFVEQSGENLRRGGESVLRGTGDLLEGKLPGSSSAPYTGRPAPTQYDANGYPIDNRVAPPQPTLADSQQAQYQQNLAQQQPNNNGYQPNSGADPYAASATPPPAGNFGSPVADPRYSTQPSTSASTRSNLAESFTTGADPYAASTPPRQMSPVPRPGATSQGSQPAATASEWDPYAADPYATRRTPVTETPRTDPLAAPEFPSLRGADGGSAWAAPDFPRSTTPTSGDFAADQTNYTNPSSTADKTTPATGWGGTAGAGDASQNVTAPRDDSRFLEKVLLVVLGAATCYMWIAYIDVRNKYRSALRNTPGGGYGVAA